MRKTETLFIGAALIVVIIVTGGAIWYACRDDNASRNYQYPTSQFGSFLAAQHAIYVNDFDSASKFAAQLTDTDYSTVQTTKFLSDFLSGRMPDQVFILEEEKTAAPRLIYDAHLVQNTTWDD